MIIHGQQLKVAFTVVVREAVEILFREQRKDFREA